MKSLSQALPVALLAASTIGHLPSRVSAAVVAPPEQYPLVFPISQPDGEPFSLNRHAKEKKLHGRFLWITDTHPDPFYETFSASDTDSLCHRGRGDAGYFGAPNRECDSPKTLVNATFDWIRQHLADKVDFVIWTGDSARHDNDNSLPRSERQILDLNRFVADQMLQTFGRNDDGDQTPKVIPTLGNNDIMPHNIMMVGPNEWTARYLDVWEPFIPEEQRHTFSMGGFYHVEVIPNRLAVFSINSLYWFAKNAGVDGCLDPEEPGAHQFKWLRIQLQRMRERGMKVFIMGHVGPARTSGKQLWDETCWQMYTLFMHQFRDIIVASMYGHMDYDHWMFQDYHEVELLNANYEAKFEEKNPADDDEEVGIMGVKNYLLDLAEDWASFPKVPKSRTANSLDEEGEEEEDNHDDVEADKKKKKKKKHRKHKKHGHKKHKKLGGEWAEAFSMSLVSPSIIPSFFPTIRIVEYNLTGAEDKPRAPLSAFPARIRGNSEAEEERVVEVNDLDKQRKKKGHKRKSKITVPKGPSKSSPPGPAYSPQTFTVLGIKQYFANLTEINNNPMDSKGFDAEKHKKQPKPHPKKFHFELEYDTRDDPILGLEDFTVRNVMRLARKIGKRAMDDEGSNSIERIEQYEDEDEDEYDDVQANEEDETSHDDVNTEKKRKKKKKHRKHKKQRKHTDLWLTFLRRVFVGTAGDDELMDKFGMPSSSTEAQYPALEADANINYEL